MLRFLPLSRNAPRCALSTARRGLASSDVLLKSWDASSASINELRAEAKSRGLSVYVYSESYREPNLYLCP